MSLQDEAKAARKADHKINEIFLQRWSPRAMTGEALDDETIMTLFEAARWAPSSYNEQPWRFIYAKRDTPEWDKVFNLMAEQNQSWAKNAAFLVVIVSSKNFAHNNNPNGVHGFDTGSAWENLALQAADLGLVAHGMAGFDFDKARTDLNVPDNYDVMAMFAVGKQAPKDTLPEEVQKMESPSPRKPVSEIIMEGSFK